jgi:hypothetical protein
MNDADDRTKRYLLWAQIAAGLFILVLVAFLFWLDASSLDFDLSTDKLGILLVAGCACLGIAIRGNKS